ncbi:MAG: hypothetical protein QOF01_4177 [Thermomicrobiales bacterium]|nr:hypothetical protein [Thermomicrobiales bacterium]
MDATLATAASRELVNPRQLLTPGKGGGRMRLVPAGTGDVRRGPRGERPGGAPCTW